MTCETCSKPVGPDARTTDGRWICDQCLRAASLWPVSRGGKSGNLYPPSKPL